MGMGWAAEAAGTGPAASAAIGTGDYVVILVSFFFFTGLVAFITWRMTRKEALASEDGFFLAGRKLTFPFIAGSLLLTNLSTEQLVGLNGDAFKQGLHVMAWEVMAVVSLVAMALFFLPKYLRSGITTVPEMLELRYGASTRTISNIIFIVAYTTILLPLVLYTGAQGLIGILDLRTLTGVADPQTLLWAGVVAVGLVGAFYALFGGMRSVAVSDTLNGIGLLAGGFMITYWGLCTIGLIDDGAGTLLAGLQKIGELNQRGMAAADPDLNRLNSVGDSHELVPYSTLFTGVLIINTFYWCTNQQIIQRTFAASSLEEGQKGVLLTGLLKLLGPLYLVLPGIMAYFLLTYGQGQADTAIAIPTKLDPDTGRQVYDSTLAYGTLVRKVLPLPLTGFFAAAMVGAILSSFNSGLNSTCTLFSLGIYKHYMHPGASEAQVVKSGKWFGWLIVALSIAIAPQLSGTGSIFTYLQTMNTIYFIPLLAVVLVGLLSKRIPAAPANFVLLAGVSFMILYYFVLKAPLAKAVGAGNMLNDYHVAAIVFVLLVLTMVVWGAARPRPTPWVHEYSGRVKLMTPWRFAKPTGALLLLLVFMIYYHFADFADFGRQHGKRNGETVATASAAAPAETPPGDAAAPVSAAP